MGFSIKLLFNLLYPLPVRACLQCRHQLPKQYVQQSVKCMPTDLKPHIIDLKFMTMMVYLFAIKRWYREIAEQPTIKEEAIVFNQTLASWNIIYLKGYQLPSSSFGDVKLQPVDVYIN